MPTEVGGRTIKSFEFLLFRFSKFVRIEIRLITQVGGRKTAIMPSVSFR